MGGCLGRAQPPWLLPLLRLPITLAHASSMPHCSKVFQDVDFLKLKITNNSYRDWCSLWLCSRVWRAFKAAVGRWPEQEWLWFISQAEWEVWTHGVHTQAHTYTHIQRGTKQKIFHIFPALTTICCFSLLEWVIIHSTENYYFGFC